jgi:hypothetical protein
VDSVAPKGSLVRVRRQWNDWRQATYRLEDIQRVHWSDSSGGVMAPAPQFFLHGYVSCADALDGEVAHGGGHGGCPHLIKVCIIKKDNGPATFRMLAEQAGPKPRREKRPDR